MKLKLEYISSHYAVKQFIGEDISSIYTLCKGNPTYYKYMKIEPTLENINEVLTALPPNKTMDDKFFMGFYKENQLIAMIDLIIEYPSTDTAYIGWFMMDKDLQGVGIGTEIIEEILSFLKKENFRYVRLGCIKENREGRAFWLKNQFQPIGVESETNHYTIIHMQRNL